MRKWDGRGDSPQGDTVNVSVSAATTGTLVVTFDPPFSSAPGVQLTVVGSSLYITYVNVAPTTTGFTIGVRRYNDVSATVTIPVRWDAKI